jgi:putative transposase
MPWREVRDVDFRTAHRHFILWARGGIFEKTYRRLLALCSRRKRDGTFLAIDTTFVKNVFGTDVLGRNPTDRGRKASKVVAVVDERGLPHRLGFLPANVSDYKVLHSVLPLPKCEKGLKVYADKGFDSEAIRKVILDAGFEPRIPKRGSPAAPWSERRRRVVERFFGVLDKCRRLILRYDKTVVAYEAWTWLASCRIAEQHIVRMSTG